MGKHRNLKVFKMEFTISRTSVWNLESLVCPEAYQKEIFFVDERTVDDPSKLRMKDDREDWYKIGANHRVENGHIKRDKGPIKVWFIRVDSLQELLKIYNKYGNLIIQQNYHNPEYMHIEIYDDYRE